MSFAKNFLHPMPRMLISRQAKKSFNFLIMFEI